MASDIQFNGHATQNGFIMAQHSELESARCASPEVTKLNLTVDEFNVEAGALEVLKVIRPQWNANDIKFKKFTDGITNKLVGCFHEPKNAQKEHIHCSKNDVVLVRVYGNKTDLLIDRTAEVRNIKMLHRFGFAPSLYATFDNGLAYEFVNGVTLDVDTVRDPKIWPIVARELARMHKVDFSEINTGNAHPEPVLWEKTQKFLDLVPNTFSDPAKQERALKLFPSVNQLRQEFDELYSHLKTLGSPPVFCHNDLLLGNIIYTETEKRITFIDYEYAACNFQAYDIGCHFSEYVGLEDIDYSRYPDKAYQEKWLRVYLEEYKGPNVSEQDVEKLYMQVNKFALATHFFWFVWGLIQAEHSSIDFDYLEYADIRYTEYKAKKELFLSLK